MRMKPIVVVNDKFILHYRMLLVIHLEDLVTDYHIGVGCVRHLSFRKKLTGSWRTWNTQGKTLAISGLL